MFWNKQAVNAGKHNKCKSSWTNNRLNESKIGPRIVAYGKEPQFFSHLCFFGILFKACLVFYDLNHIIKRANLLCNLIRNIDIIFDFYI